MTTTAALTARDAAEAQISSLWPLAYGPLPHDATAHARIFKALAGLADTVARDIYAVRDAEVLATLTPAARWQAQADRTRSVAYGT